MKVRQRMDWAAGPLFAHWADGGGRSWAIDLHFGPEVEWSHTIAKQNRVELVEWSSKVEWSLWSRAIFLEVELSQTGPND